MNVKIRTLSAIDRAMPKRLLLKRVGPEWREEIVMSVYEAMKALERDATKVAINDAANAVGNHVEGGYRHPAFEAVLALHKRPRKTRRAGR